MTPAAHERSAPECAGDALTVAARGRVVSRRAASGGLAVPGAAAATDLVGVTTTKEWQ